MVLSYLTVAKLHPLTAPHIEDTTPQLWGPGILPLTAKYSI